MKNYNLNISAPTDGRYSGLCEEINKIFSEHNLIKMRVKAEIEWFKAHRILSGIRLFEMSIVFSIIIIHYLLQYMLQCDHPLEGHLSLQIGLGIDN